jgi:uncharacterized protein YyaL (SSP411 family)
MSLLMAFLMAMGITIKESPVEEVRQGSNRLGLEKSPYLLQHANNPIWWYPWGEEALAAAKAENKPVFLSVGYSTCYWCHFMEKDSFEKEDVAKLLNAHFISIKVDREERPDVDQIYMDALVAMTGSGGWPMSMFLTPEGKPFFGATVIQHDQFLNVLGEIAKAWKSQPERILQGGAEIGQHLARQAAPPSAASSSLGEEAFRAFYRQIQKGFDPFYGGFSPAPKFPRSMLLSALLRIHRRTEDGRALLMTKTTLDAMARGGMYDHLGGGFHRYSTDPEWLVPHFEKMLYDNALLAATYLEAHQVTQEAEYARVARGILEYVLRDMTHPDGGFYSAEDAGEVGREGEYYVWKEAEVKTLLTPEEFAKVQTVYGVSAKGNFEHGQHILRVRLEDKLPDGSDPILEQARSKLFAARSQRKRPHLDDKVLTSWNGLMIAAMAQGYQALGEERYLRAAQGAARFVLDRLVTKDGTLLRRWRDGEAKFPAYADDYAFLIHGLLALYQSDFDPAWLKKALALQAAQDRLFWDKDGGAYFFSDGSDKTLLVRGKEFEDGARPSGNSISALNLLQLADLTHRPEWKKRADRIFAAAGGVAAQYPSAFPQLLVALDYALDRSKEIAVVGPLNHAETRAIVRDLHRAFLPNKVLAAGPPSTKGNPEEAPVPLLARKPMIDDRPTAYVCENGVCKLPTGDLAAIRKLAAEMRTYTLQ